MDSLFRAKIERNGWRIKAVLQSLPKTGSSFNPVSNDYRATPPLSLRSAPIWLWSVKPMDESLRNDIIRMFYSRTSQRRIAKKLGIDRKTVATVIAEHEQSRTGEPPKQRKPRKSVLDPFEDKIVQLLERYPEITAVRMLEELRRLGFQGGYTILKDHLRDSGAVTLGVPAAVVTGGLLVAGAASTLITAYSLYTNPSSENIGYNLGALSAGAIVGGVTGRGLASTLSPPENQPVPGWPDWSPMRDLRQMWRWGGPEGSRSPWAMYGDFCKAMRTGPNPPGAAGATAVNGTGLANIWEIYSR